MHLTPLDILLFGLVAFAAWRMFGNRRRPDSRPPDQSQPPAAPGRPGQEPGPEPGPEPGSEEDEEERRRQASEAYRRAQSSWDHLRSAPRPDRAPGPQSAPSPDAAPGPAGRPAAPGQDDEAEFLEGAKAMYARIRESWGDRDLDDLAQFLTPRCLAEFKSRAGGEEPAGRTDVLLVDARILDMAPAQARVRYSALVREAGKGDAPRQANEDWTFVRPAGDTSATWKLDALAEAAD